MAQIQYIRPQKGYQEDSLSSSADIVIGGAAAGVGKTFGLLIEPLRHVKVPGFGGVIFRRTSPMIRAEGGLWDSSEKLYNLIDGVRSRRSQLEWIFDTGVKLKFSHLEYEKNIYDWQGSEIPFIGFDELTHFTKKMFFYLLSRNRSTCGIRPYIRATCNPDPDSWVRDFIDWWIGDDGFPIEERKGVIRYFVVDNNNYVWGDTKEECIEKSSHVIGELLRQAEEKAVERGVESTIKAEDFVKSVTFIGGSIYDNQELLKVNPGYLGNLNAQDEETKARLLGGNWNVKASKIDVYGYHAVRDMKTNSFLENTYKYAPKRITTDIALKGSDKFIVFVWQGKMLIDALVMSKSKGNQVIDAIKLMAMKHGVSFNNILFDNDGVGQFIDGFIPNAREFNNGARPINGENYQNLKSQCYIKSGDAVNRNEYYVHPRVWNMKYDESRTFGEQILYERKAIKRGKPDNDGKLCVIPKKEMKTFIEGGSPDVWDAFMMNERFYIGEEEVEVDYS